MLFLFSRRWQTRRSSRKALSSTVCCSSVESLLLEDMNLINDLGFASQLRGFLVPNYSKEIRIMKLNPIKYNRYLNKPISSFYWGTGTKCGLLKIRHDISIEKREIILKTEKLTKMFHILHLCRKIFYQ